jgi:hypothetical protein
MGGGLLPGLVRDLRPQPHQRFYPFAVLHRRLVAPEAARCAYPIRLGRTKPEMREEIAEFGFLPTFTV